MKVELNYAEDTVYLVEDGERVALPVALADLRPQAVVNDTVTLRFTLTVDELTTVKSEPETEVADVELDEPGPRLSQAQQFDRAFDEILRRGPGASRAQH